MINPVHDVEAENFSRPETDPAHFVELHFESYRKPKSQHPHPHFALSGGSRAPSKTSVVGRC
jgi:hypothetical protein